MKEKTPKKSVTLRLDADIVIQFKALATVSYDEIGYQTLMNRALREWLETRGFKEPKNSQSQTAVAITQISAMAKESKHRF